MFNKQGHRQAFRIFQSASLALVCLFLVTPSFAQSVAKGINFKLLHQLQGPWRSDCQSYTAGERGLYQKIHLKVSYTEFEFKVRNYSDDSCRKQLAEYTRRYAFALGGPLASKEGKKVYALDFKALPSPQSAASNADTAFAMDLKTIVQYKNGKLVFGLPKAIKSDERILRLDPRFHYYR